MSEIENSKDSEQLTPFGLCIAPAMCTQKAESGLHWCAQHKEIFSGMKVTDLSAEQAPEAKPYKEEPGRDYRKERDAAYTERNRLVAALARILLKGEVPAGLGGTAWLAEHDPADAGWDPEWRTIVFIAGPTGQLSWHLHDSDVPLFDGLPRGPNSWDGHTTVEKYERVARLGR